MNEKTLRYDAVIIGGGHNGLVCGAYLAKIGKKVCVLEKRPTLGGAAATEEIWQGYRVNTASHMMGLLQPRVILDLELAKFGFEVITPPPSIHLLEGGRTATLWGDPEKMALEIAQFSKNDAENYIKYWSHLASMGSIFEKLLWEIPFDPADFTLSGLLKKMRFTAKNIGLLRKFSHVAELMTMSANDYLSRWFEAEETKVMLGYYPAAGSGQCVSINTPGTAFYLIRSHVRNNKTKAGGIGLVKGGMASICDAIVESGKRFGLETRVNSAVSRIEVESGRASGVVLSDGTKIGARCVVANAAIQHVVANLVPHGSLPESYIKTITGLHSQSSAFKVHIATSKPPMFAGSAKIGEDTPDNSPVQYVVAPSLRYLERAFLEMKQGEISKRPFMTVQIPTLVDPSLAPKGQHILSIYGGHVPTINDVNALPQIRARVLQLVETTLAAHAKLEPNWIEHSHVMLANDYESQFGLPGGNPHHYNVSLDQMFFSRPAHKYSDYASPLKGLFLCGASAHPGGAVTGVPGYNAAKIVASTLRKGNLF